MFDRVHQSRIFHAFLTMVFVYQLNACPCGHLEHNDWYELGRTIFENATALSVKALNLPSTRTTKHIDDFHCDATDQDYYFSEVSTLGSEDLLSNAVYICSNDSLLLDSSQRSQAEVLFFAAKLVSSDLDVRAHHQIFLI